MKRIILYAAALSVFVGCTKEIDNTIPSPSKDTPVGEEVITIYANVNQTKTTVDGSGVFSWSDSETIATIDKESDVKRIFEVVSTTDGTFTGTHGVGGELSFAVSPADFVSNMIDLSGDVSYRITLPTAVNNYVPGTTNAVMVAGAPEVVSSNFKFTFYQAASLMKFSFTNIPIGTKSFVLTMDQNIAGYWDLDSKSGVELDGAYISEGSKTVALNLSSAVASPGQSMVFCVPVPTANYNSFKVQLLDASGVVLSGKRKTLASAQTLAVGDIYPTPSIDASTGATDVINQDFTGISGTSYTDFDSAKQGTISSAIYDGNCAGDKGSVQLRASSSSGIITKTSGGLAKKVVVVWQDDTVDGRTLDIYGKSTAYTSSANLYGTAAEKGTKLGSIVKGTSTELAISGDYEFIGLRSNSNSMYITSIKITWMPDNREKLAAPTFSPAGGEVASVGSTVTISSVEGSTVYYTIDGTTPTASSSVYSDPIAINDDLTLKAFAIKSGYKSSNVTSVDYTVPQCSTPTLSPGSSTVDSGTVITISSTTTGSTIYYTINGDTPVVGGGTTTAGDSGTATATVTVTSARTIKAIAVKSGLKNSEVGSESYLITGITTLTNPSSVAITAISSSGFTATWANDANASSYTWMLSTSSTAPASDTDPSVVSHGTSSDAVSGSTWTLTKTGLTLSGKYYFYVKAIGDGLSYADSGYSSKSAITLKFNLTSNPGGWPTANSTTLTDYTYTLNKTAYTFKLYNVKQNSGYLMLTKTAGLGLPAITGYKLVKVVANNTAGCSTSTKVGISSTAPTTAKYVTGGGTQTWSTQGSTYTYSLSSTSNNTVYYVYVTSANAQITYLELTYFE